jgi:hypothetical protein
MLPEKKKKKGGVMVYFYVLKIFLKKFKFVYFFLQINIF